MVRYIIGPEIIWLISYWMIILPAKLKVTIPKAWDNFIETIWFWMPVFTLLNFILWWIPAIEKHWLLPRVWITALIGGFFLFENITNAYGKTGPGIGTGWMVCIMLMLLVLIAGTIIIKIKF